MSSVQSILTYISLLVYFFSAIFIALYIPGSVIFRRFFKKNIASIEEFLVSTSLGIVLWAIQGFVLGYAGIRFMTYVYILYSLYVFFKDREYYLHVIKNIVRESLSLKIGVISFFLLGVASQIIQSIPSSIIFPSGWYTYIADDSLWHVGLTEELVRHMPPQQPGISSVALTGYHYLGNLVIADFIRVFHIPLFLAQFSGIYILLSFLFGGMMYVVLRSLHLTKTASMYGVILSYFSSDIIYLVSYISSKKFVWNVHPLEDGTMFLENPPRAFSYVLTLLGIYVYIHWIKKPIYTLGTIVGVVFGIIIGFKVHTGFMVIMGMLITGMLCLVRRHWVGVWTTVVTVTTALIFYLPVNGHSGGPIIAPFEMARMFVVQPSLNLSSYELKRIIYSEHNNILRIFQVNLEMLAIFIVAQFGVRTLGFIGMYISRKKEPSAVYILLIYMCIGTFLFGTIFIQPLTWADIFNSYLAGGVILTIFTSVCIEWLLRKRIAYTQIFLILSLCVFLVPRYVYRMNNFLIRYATSRPMISIHEIQAANYIKTHSNASDIILVFNSGSFDSLWSYVSALTQRSTFLSGQMMLKNRQINYQNRQDFIERVFFQNAMNDSDKSILQSIAFLYVYNDSKNTIQIPQQFRTAYINTTITLFKNDAYEFD